jgi:hypothetical protein
MTAKPASGKAADPEAELRALLGRLEPEIQELARAVRAALRKRFPTANELAYDYGTFVVLAYTPTERGIDGIASIAARPDGVRLYLVGRPKLPDPRRLLQGTGKQARYVPLESARRLADPDVQALIDAAVDQAAIPLPPGGRGRLILQSTRAKPTPKSKPRPRR